MQNDISKMTVEQLKAFAYDQMMLLNQIQNNINIINQELAKRESSKEVKDGITTK